MGKRLYNKDRPVQDLRIGSLERPYFASG